MKDLMVNYGYIVWVCWLVGFVSIFALFETWALMTHGLSLSQATYTVCSDWPPMIFIYGFLTGFLVCHFYWHWVPKGGPVQGG